jgi:hypothetical protein
VKLVQQLLLHNETRFMRQHNDTHGNVTNMKKLFHLEAAMNKRIVLLSALTVLLCASPAIPASDRDGLIAYYKEYLEVVQAPSYPKLVQNKRAELVDTMDRLARKSGFKDAQDAENAWDRLANDPDVAAMRKTLDKAIEKQLGGRRE